MIPLLFSQTKVVREVHESYSINKETELAITNKYGNIDIRNWDKQQVDVKVQIVVEELSEKKIEEILKAIKIEYGKEGEKIYFKTSYDDDLSKNIFSFGNGGKQFEVNYIVNMPHSLLVHLNNKYGNIFIDKLSSPSKVELKYGNLKANDLKSENKDPMTQLVLGYSEGNIEVCSWLKIITKYSKINIEESKALIVVSKYSKINVERGSSIVTESKYDEYRVGTIANFVTDASYTNFRFRSIGKKLQSESNYSDFKISFMPASFEKIKIVNKYGSYKIGVEQNASYHIKGYSKYGNIVIPDIGRINRIQENTELTLEGLVGDNSNTDAKVIIESKYGTIKLIE
jgi:hypothetical protein